MAPSIDFIDHCPEPLEPWPDLLEDSRRVLAGACLELDTPCQLQETSNAEGTLYLILGTPESATFSILVSGFPLYQCLHCFQYYFPIEEAVNLEQRLTGRMLSKRPLVSVPYWTLRHDPESLSA